MRIHVQATPNEPTAITREQWRDAAGRAGEAGFELSFGEDEAAFAAALGTAEALITNGRALRHRLPGAAPALRMIFLTHAGVDTLAPFDWLPPGVALVNNSGTHGDKGGEYAAMAVLMLANHVPAFVTQQQRESWGRQRASVLAGRRATVVGLGALGSGAAKRLRLFGMQVTGVRTRAEPHPNCDQVVADTELDAVLADTEFLVLACPLTPRTHTLLDRSRIARLPAGAGVVNIGRGALIEQDALLDALDSGHLGGAVLDVFVPEPVPPGHRLWRTPNLVMTPHMSSDDHVTYNSLSLDVFFRNLRAHREGRPLPNQVDLDRGY